jgi:hypothetical protein
MRFAVVFALALTLSGCTWVQRQIGPETVTPPPQTATPPAPLPKPEPVKPRRLSKPVPAQASPAPQAPVAAPPDSVARCREMADNRADDAKELGVGDADRQRLRDDTYRNCMAQPVKGVD